MKFSIKDFFSKCNEILSADLVTFTEETLNGKFHFLCNDECKLPLRIREANKYPKHETYNKNKANYYDTAEIYDAATTLDKIFRLATCEATCIPSLLY